MSDPADLEYGSILPPVVRATPRRSVSKMEIRVSRNGRAGCAPAKRPEALVGSGSGDAAVHLVDEEVDDDDGEAAVS